MGNYQLKPLQKGGNGGLPQPGTKCRIIHDDFSSFQEIPADVLKLNKEGIIVSCQKMSSSRQNVQPVVVCYVKFPDNSIELFHIDNIQILGK